MKYFFISRSIENLNLIDLEEIRKFMHPYMITLMKDDLVAYSLISKKSMTLRYLNDDFIAVFSIKEEDLIFKLFLLSLQFNDISGTFIIVNNIVPFPPKPKYIKFLPKDMKGYKFLFLDINKIVKKYGNLPVITAFNKIREEVTHGIVMEALKN